MDVWISLNTALWIAAGAAVVSLAALSYGVLIGWLIAYKSMKGGKPALPTVGELFGEKPIDLSALGHELDGEPIPEQKRERL